MPDSLGFSKIPRLAAERQHVEHVLIQKTLARIFAFTGVDIDDVINNPIARNKVISYYKLHRWINRECEIRELERQWNPLKV
jgi:hypothetical protein